LFRFCGPCTYSGFQFGMTFFWLHSDGDTEWPDFEGICPILSKTEGPQLIKMNVYFILKNVENLTKNIKTRNFEKNFF
jgi:hypothetical protein